MLGTVSLIPAQAVGTANKVSYVPCPECERLMNRVNFAKCSGAIVDVCKGHGTWFDRDELIQIAEFVRGGDSKHLALKRRSRLRKRTRQLRREQLVSDTRRLSILGIDDSEDHRARVIASARGLLKMLLD